MHVSRSPRSTAPVSLLRKAAPFLLMAFAALAGLSSCSSNIYPMTPETTVSKPGGGFIAATFEGKGFTANGGKVDGPWCTRLYVRGTGATSGTKTILLPHVMPIPRDPALIGGGLPSPVVAVPVPAGDYEIYAWSVTMSPNAAPILFINRVPMKIPFRVNAGETTYVGRVKSAFLFTRSVAPQLASIPDDVFVMMKDELGTDAPRISKMYRSIPRSSIRNSDVPAGFKAWVQRSMDTPPKFLGLF